MEEKTRKHIMLSDETLGLLENYMITNDISPKKFSHTIEQAIRNLCSSQVQEKQTAPFDIEKKLNEIAKDVRIGNIAALRAFHNLKVDVEDLSFDIDKTQLGFLAQNDFDQALRKKQTLVSERVKKTPTKTANPFFDRG